ncbi:MAG: hypothetical protein ACKOZT_02445 [Cyanobium sp.]
MARPPHRWSITLAASSDRHPRWLDENGHFSSDPARALRLASPEVAVQRVQAFLSLHGWAPTVLDRFRLVPSPLLHDKASARGLKSLGDEADQTQVVQAA